MENLHFPLLHASQSSAHAPSGYNTVIQQKTTTKSLEIEWNETGCLHHLICELVLLHLIFFPVDSAKDIIIAIVGISTDIAFR